MQVVFHIGAHQTDQGLLLRSLLKNSDLLLAHDVAVPGPSRYRRSIGQIVNTLRGNQPDQATRDELLDSLLDIEAPDRLILSSDAFMCVAERALEEGQLYARAFKTAWLRQLFPDAPVVFALAIRNPATFIPSLLGSERLAGLRYEDVMNGTDPSRLRWSDLVARLREINPESPVIVWCNEDTPVIWPDILHLLTGIEDDIRLTGEYDMLGRIMRRRGMRRFNEFLSSHPEATQDERREVLFDLLETHTVESRMVYEIDLPGWTAGMVDAMTDAYDADLDRIRAMPGVHVIEP